MTEHVFPLLNYWWFYAAFTGLVVALLALVFSANRALASFHLSRFG
jgi:hypothetical protein